ncbi:ProP protein [Blastopirellula marina DSM 3645]|uniref:ProP protein n=2 Tax=Blastopirellula marina TaxID=124 RepID=A4A2T2_9BACT|nr:ProP protein [Blastopirellula marina DSM 3645]
MFSLSMMMFLQFFIWGAWYVTVGNFMNSRGMFDEVSWAYTVGPIAAIISPFFLGFVADRYFATEKVLGTLHLLGGVTMFIAPFAAGISPTLFIIVLLLHMLCYMPTLGLTNTLAFHNIENQERQFPIIRVFGTIGWIAANLVVSKVFQADTSEMQFYITGAAALALGVFSFALPHTPPPSAGKKVTFREIMGVDALALMKERSFAVFIVSSFLICIPLAAYYAYAPVFVGKVGFTSPGAWMSIGQVSEIIFMLLIPIFFAYLGVKWMLFVGMFAWVLRYGLFSAADEGNMWMLVLAGIVLHGICYDFFFVTGFIYTDKKCSKELRGQAQGFLVFVTQGLGLGIGAKLVGYIVKMYTPPEAQALQAEAQKLTVQAYGMTDLAAAAELREKAGELGGQAVQMMDWGMIWLIPCIFAGVIMILFGLLFHDKAADETSMTSEDEASSPAAH